MNTRWIAASSSRQQRITPGKSQPRAGDMRYQTAQQTKQAGKAIAKRILRPFPAHCAAAMRWESMSDTFTPRRRRPQSRHKRAQRSALLRGRGPASSKLRSLQAQDCRVLRAPHERESLPSRGGRSSREEERSAATEPLMLGARTPRLRLMRWKGEYPQARPYPARGR